MQAVGCTLKHGQQQQQQLDARHPVLACVEQTGCVWQVGLATQQGLSLHADSEPCNMQALLRAFAPASNAARTKG